MPNPPTGFSCTQHHRLHKRKNIISELEDQVEELEQASKDKDKINQGTTGSSKIKQHSEKIKYTDNGHTKKDEISSQDIENIFLK